MAEAGFYFSGSISEVDTAKCFMCYKVLDGWESTDDPWLEHKKHSPNCPFVKKGVPENELTVNNFFKLLSSPNLSMTSFILRFLISWTC